MIPSQKKRFLFVTSAIGSQEIEEAANRLIKTAESLRVFERCIMVTESSLIELAPELIRLVPAEDWNIDKKFGYYIWKPIIARAATSGTWGDYDGVFYLDAGCQILPTYWNRRAVIKFFSKASRLGVVVFSTGGEENRFTKSRVFDLFPNIDMDCKTPQIAGGSWVLSGTIGRDIAAQWAWLATSNYDNINEKIESGKESPGLIAPRHDQSIFSLLCKSKNIVPEEVMPPGGGSSYKTQIRSLFFPFSWSRNRTGTDSTSFVIRAIGSISLICYFFFINLIKRLPVTFLSKTE